MASNGTRLRAGVVGAGHMGQYHVLVYAELPDVELVGVEPAGGAAVGHGVPGIVHGSKSYLLQDEWGQVVEAESISAGLDYPGIGPEHAHLAEIGRARYEKVTDAEVLDAFQVLARTEGIIAALESAHALAWVLRAREELAGKVVVLNLSGRGDKDVAQVARILDDERGGAADG
jgi:tryptophan synthase beta chain